MSRSVKKGPFIEARLLAGRGVNKRNEKRVVKTWSRASIIFPTLSARRSPCTTASRTCRSS